MSSAESERTAIELRDRSAWERWLETNHASADGVWLKIAKKNAPVATVTQAEALEEAVCFGWIDGQVRRLDEHFYVQRFTPRRARSTWSEINRARAQRLIAEGRMRPAGLAQYRAAQDDGRLADAYAPQSRATVPADFRAALDENRAAREFFATLRGSERYAFLYRLHHVKDARRRAERIRAYVARLAERRTLA